MLTEIITFVQAYRYWAILPFALFEAPLMSIVIGFFAATGYVSFLPAFGIVVAGDFIGDTALYVFGRWCRPLFEKIGVHLNIAPARARKVLEYFGRRDRRAIVISKLVHGVGFTGLIVAGSVRVPYARFAVTCVIVTILQSAVLAVIGMFSGKAYESVAHYLGYFDIVAAAFLLLVVFVLYRAFIKAIDEGETKA